jgi:hypothetical protein
VKRHSLVVAEHPLQCQTADALPLELARPAKCCVIVWCGVLHYLWRAVDRHGVGLDILAQEQRRARAKALRVWQEEICVSQAA